MLRMCEPDSYLMVGYIISSKPNIIRMFRENEMNSICSTHGYMKTAFKSLLKIFRRKGSLGRYRNRWEDYI
jgi:hypothetical protein